jgi:DNA-binding MarR family transcriptional regulator
MLHLPAQTLTGMIDQLEAAGLVRRSPNPADRRSTIVDLTDTGSATVDRICPPLIQIEQDCMSTLSASEQSQIMALLAKVDARITQRRA